MYQEELNLLINKWESMIYSVLKLEKILAPHLQQTLKETYEALRLFHQRKHVPKELCKLFVEIDTFRFFASLMEEKEVGDGYYYCLKVDIISKALKDGFFNGNYECEFPKLKLGVLDETLFFDFNADDLSKLEVFTE